MSFAQFHDGFYRNPKVRRAGSLGAWMWAASIGYASENLTDGFIPSHELAALCSDLDTKPRLKVAAKLVEVGLWEVVDGGWRIHDYLNWNLSKAAIIARREANLARVNKHRGKVPRHGEGNARVMHYNEHYTAGDSARTNAPPSGPTSSDPSPLVGGVTAGTPARAREDIEAMVDDAPRAPTRERESIASANGPSTTPQSRTLLDDLRTATGARATLVGTLAEERGLADMLARLSPTPDEVRAMGIAFGAPASWWPQGKTPAPKHVTLRALSGFRGADGQPEWGPLAGLVAHVRAKGVAQRVRPLPRPVVDDGGVTEEDIRFGAERAAALRAKLAQGGGR